MSGTIPLLIVWALVSSPQSDHKSTLDRQQIAQNQSVKVAFLARVVKVAPVSRPLPEKRYIKGYLVHEKVKWELRLDVLPHNNFAPFQAGRRTCYLNNLESVFGTEDVSRIHGTYKFSFIWNISVPGKPEFEDFTAISCPDSQ